jgi:hypothetical protein
VDVNSIVPAGFDAYVRVFHPAADLGAADDRSQDVAVTWREIARRCGTTAHPRMQLHALTGTWDAFYRAVPGVYDHPPSVGTLPQPTALAVSAALAGHTGTPDRCWFAAWEGMGSLRHDVAAAPRFEVPHRRYHLLQGGIGAAAESIGREPWEWSAQIWWPDDHAWCVATEVDLNTTYIGCSRDCRDALVGRSGLEALEIAPTSGISYESDEVNAAPPRHG